ncbi:MAG: hypothetical protein ACRD2T_02850 [Thermoanaerobaculia bacterium]
MVGGLGWKTLARTIHPDPTQAEEIQRVADAFNRSRLTPRVQRRLERRLAWYRNCLYHEEARRGLDAVEDLASWPWSSERPSPTPR